jgi:hypothetical protein
MTQQADPRHPFAQHAMNDHARIDNARIDTSVDAETTAPGVPTYDTPPAQPAGWPPTAQAWPAAPMSPPVGIGPMPMGPPAPMAAPEPKLNTLSWISVVVAFIAAPVAIVLGLVARSQIRRTGERGKGLALAGTILGSVFTVIGVATVVVVLVMASTFTAGVSAATNPAPVPAAAPAPVAVAPAPAPVATGPTNDDYAAGQADLMTGFLQVGSAAETMSSNLQQHSGDLDAIHGDIATYRTAIAQFRTTATTATLSPDVRHKVDTDLVPAIDRVLSDLDTLSSSSSQSKLSAAADRLQTDSQAMVTAATAAVGS